ncbi:Kelch repeat-containing protein [Spirosoma montaniterrae]|uniref:Galactose oxidase n=1 Tax=Spirosoma montaniterrae TaxID=1178516 RepID=A0A1P9WVA2_9BACT|nr:kelch repeat-containing protein [Spirosoma montaniterrae]AQG79304.1 galactose oxidase [Spirosoma montaniterrae]
MKRTILPLFILLTTIAQAQTWQPVQTQNTCDVRHENAAALVGDSLYAIGGRGMKPLEALNLKTLVWQRLPSPPVEMNHFQAVTYNGEIYVMGAFQGKYPHETALPNIHMYSPRQGKWRTGPTIPTERLRGSAGVVVRQNKIYMVCGIIDGHYDGHVAWFDEYDPKTNAWKRLPDAPRTRDHISATLVGDKLVLAGGRNSTARIGKVLETTIAEVDVYDFKTGRWETLPATSNIPTQRAGATAVTLNGKAYVIGGETVQLKAHNEAEIFDPATNRWTAGPTLQQGRHGTQAVVYDRKIYIVAGSANHGGGPELNTVEVLK